MGVYILRDSIHDSKVSKIHNFSFQWLKWNPVAKISHPNYKFTEDDILIVNLDDGNPYGKDKFPKKCKKLFIVHNIDGNNYFFLEDADYVIYINDIQRQIAEDVLGITKPNMVAPRHPMMEFHTTVTRKESMFMGGWFTPRRTEDLYDKLKSIHKKLPEECDILMMPVWGSVQDNIDAVNKFANRVKGNFNPRTIILETKELTHDIMVLNTRICKYGYLWDNGFSIEEVNDLIVSKDPKILDNHNGESSMLAILQSSPKDLIVENSIRFLPYFTKVGKYTYQQFAQLVGEALKNI